MPQGATRRSLIGLFIEGTSVKGIVNFAGGRGKLRPGNSKNLVTGKSLRIVASSGRNPHRRIDLFVVYAANIINISMGFLFVVRMLGFPLVEKALGIVVLFLGFSLGYVAYINKKNKRDKWEVFLLLPVFFFCIIELILDYILVTDWRSSALVGPYLLLYYFSLWMLIGYSFRFEKKWGYITLATYFLNMFLSLYQYALLGR
jgi:hypothetical protein